MKNFNSNTQAENFERAYYQAWRDVRQTGPEWSYEHLSRRYYELLYRLDLKGKSILEVGAGDGFLSHYLALLKDVKYVVSLDEYEGHGSDAETYKINLRLQEILNDSDKVKILKSDFLKYHSSKKFHFILFVNVLHHIVATEKKLSDDSDSQKLSENLFKLTKDLISPDGAVIIQEVSRFNICPIPKYRKQMSIINWKSKQSPREWLKVLKRVGFNTTSLRYRLPLNLPNQYLFRMIFNNCIASSLTDSSYIITAKLP